MCWDIFLTFVCGTEWSAYTQRVIIILTTSSVALVTFDNLEIFKRNTKKMNWWSTLVLFLFFFINFSSRFFFWIYDYWIIGMFRQSMRWTRVNESWHLRSEKILHKKQKNVWKNARIFFSSTPNSTRNFLCSIFVGTSDWRSCLTF